MQLFQTAFLLLLVGVLAASVISVAIMALVQIARTRRLSREADSLEMRFAAEDPFDVPRRYADFAVISHGHSPRASNVMYGRVGGRRIRAFDFRYELGHGPRRVTRRYDVVVVETDQPLPEGLMWHRSDTEFAPPSVRGGDSVESWLVRGDRAVVPLLQDNEIASAVGMSIQVCGTVLMLFASEINRKEGYVRRIREAVNLTDLLNPPQDVSSQANGGEP